jgi:hypothetical protein
MPRIDAALFAAATTLTLLVSAPVYANANTVTCAMTSSADEMKGTCDIPCMVNELAINIDGPDPKKTCDKPTRTVNVTLKKTDRENHWLGTMEGRQPEDPTRFEAMTVADGKPGVAKTPFGWFAMTAFAQDNANLSITIDANRQLPPTADDVKIVERATALLADEKVWNKNDDRKCAPNPTQWSVFCAMMQATDEVSGGIHYRQPAMQALRETVAEIGGERVKKHRLMDYNNHPDTTLADIHNLLKLTQARLEKRMQ